jgi:hypothetical protein
MIKKFIAASLVIFLFGCNSNNNEETTSNDSATTEVGGVENVNGNIPDTASMGATPNSGDNQPHVDSSYADTAKKINP